MFILSIHTLVEARPLVLALGSGDAGAGCGLGRLLPSLTQLPSGLHSAGKVMLALELSPSICPRLSLAGSCNRIEMGVRLDSHSKQYNNYDHRL